MHKHMKAIQRACIFLLVLFMLLVPLSALGESKTVQPAEETRAGLCSPPRRRTPPPQAQFFMTHPAA